MASHEISHTLHELLRFLWSHQVIKIMDLHYSDATECYPVYCNARERFTIFKDSPRLQRIKCNNIEKKKLSHKTKECDFELTFQKKDITRLQTTTTNKVE